jgi:hypothetical protein
MAQAKALYVIFVDEAMLTAPLEKSDFRYFLNGILPNLRPISDEDYTQGPAVIIHTLARYSYIVYREDVYWCSEWDPGLIVVRFSPDGSMAWTALRSPIPNFGGRKTRADDLRDYDEDAVNHQYNLVFRAWDAQFDELCREWRAFQRADAKTAGVFQAALAHADELGEQTQARCADEDAFSRWTSRCRGNLRKWAGEGIRVTL